MAISKEVIATIVNFSPREEIVRKKMEIDLGEVARDARVVYGIYPYQQRVVSLPGEPLVQSWTEQPVVALVQDGMATPLPYAAEVKGLGDSLAIGVALRLKAAESR